MTAEEEPPRDKTPILTAKLAQLLHDHPDFYTQIFPPGNERLGPKPPSGDQ